MPFQVSAFGMQWFPGAAWSDTRSAGIPVQMKSAGGMWRTAGLLRQQSVSKGAFCGAALPSISIIFNHKEGLLQGLGSF